MIIDFRRVKSSIEPLTINGKPVELVKDFKLLGTFLSNDLTWHTNLKDILSKSRQRLFFLRLLKSYGLNQSILVNFYRCIIESILSRSIIVWYKRASQRDILKLKSVIKNAEKIIGVTLPSIESIYQERALRRTHKILADEHHPAHSYFEFLRSGSRLKTFRGNKRLTNSFYPDAVKIFNSRAVR